MKGIIEIIYILVRYGEKKLFWNISSNLFFIVITGILELVSSYSLVSLGQFLSTKALPNSIPFLNFVEDNQFINIIILVMLSSTLSSIIKVYLIDLQYKLSGNIGSRLSFLLTDSLLNKTWKVNKIISDKSEYVTSCVTHVPNIVGVTNHFITLLSSAVFVVGLLAGLMISSPKITISMMFIIGSYYLISIIVVRKPLISVSKVISNLLRLVQQLHSEIYDLRKEIKISNKEKDWSSAVYERYYKLTLAQKLSGLLSESPRIIIEMLVILSICIIILLNQSNNYIIDILAVIFILIQKVMPNIQKIFSSISIGMAYRGGIDSVIRALKSIKKESENKEITIEENRISKCNLLNIEFKKREEGFSLSGNIFLERGSITCIIGKSGSGKTTLINNIIENEYSQFINFNDIDNNIKISHELISNISSLVPQSPKLVTGSLEDNILLNAPRKSNSNNKKINDNILESCLIIDLKDKLKSLTISSETSNRGLSGGQIQRISIARALHMKSDILILDEPTSALDDLSSSRIIENILRLHKSKFILLITHDKSLINYSKRVYEINNGKLKLI